MTQLPSSGLEALLKQHPELQCKVEKLVADELSGGKGEEFIEQAKAFPIYVFDGECHGKRQPNTHCHVLNTFGNARAGTVLFRIGDTNACMVKVEDQELVVHESEDAW